MAAEFGVLHALVENSGTVMTASELGEKTGVNASFIGECVDVG